MILTLVTCSKNIKLIMINNSKLMTKNKNKIYISKIKGKINTKKYSQKLHNPLKDPTLKEKNLNL